MPFMVLLLANTLFAQRRYLDPVFNDVSVTEDVIYAVNATVLLLPLVGQAIPRPQEMDVYQPIGDTETARPLVVLLHAGNFLHPQTNGGCTGTRKDASLVFMARELAKRGYVAAVAEYRLGWSPLSPDYLTRVVTFANAIYRGVQDSRTCVRYFNRSVAESGNPFRVDSERITILGAGAGGYISLASMALDTITDTWIPPFMTLAGPMLLEEVNGDVDGLTVGVTFPGYPGFPPGDTLCYPNHVGYSSEFQLAVNLGGALGHPSWLDSSDPPIISFHVPTDPTAPCGEGSAIIFPSVNLPVFDVVGSCFVQDAVVALGINDIFNNQTFLDPISAIARERNGGVESFFPFLTSGHSAESSPWAYSTSAEPYGVPGANCPVDSAAAQMAIDTIMTYFLPRACLALDLGCDLSEFIVSASNLVDPALVKLAIAPNPARNEAFFTSADDAPMRTIELYDISGRLVQQVANVNASNYTLPRGSLKGGLYVAKVRFDKGVSAQKLIFD